MAELNLTLQMGDVDPTPGNVGKMLIAVGTQMKEQGTSDVDESLTDDALFALRDVIRQLMHDVEGITARLTITNAELGKLLTNRLTLRSPEAQLSPLIQVIDTPDQSPCCGAPYKGTDDGAVCRFCRGYYNESDPRGQFSHSDLVWLFAHPAHNGHGYLSSSRQAMEEDRCQAMDAAVVAQANHLDLTRLEFFLWLDSKLARWCVERVEADGAGASIPPVVARFLNRGEIDKLMQEET